MTVEERPLYTHLWLREECSSMEKAGDFTRLWNEMIDCLGEKMPVFVRLSPTVFTENDFESNNTMYRAMCRVSIGPSWIGVASGITQSQADIYDNGELTGFGLAKHDNDSL